MADKFQIALTAAEFNQLAERFKAQGLGDAALVSGTLPETKGVLLSYQVTRASGVSAMITFTIQKKPFFATVGLIQNQVKKVMGLS